MRLTNPALRLRRLSAALLTLGTTVALGAVAPAAVRAAPAPLAGAPAGRATTVTLITGDRVTFTAGSTSVQRGPGRAGVRFVGRTAGTHRYVIPLDALPLVQAGRVDARLFDLTALERFGYTRDADLPLLVAYPRTGRSKGPASFRSAIGARARVIRDLPGAGALAVRAARPDRARLWTSMITGTPAAPALRPGIERISLDGKRELTLDVSVPQIGAPAAWARGLDGTGVTVAVLDSGIDATHADFAGRIVAQENFTAAPSTDDVYGHGTHVASIVAGSGAKSGGRYRGVAPGAKLAIGKICEARWCEESAILAGMEWAARTAPVVNMSFGSDDLPGVDPVEQAVEDLTAEHGTLFVVAAGNSGALGGHTVGSPGTADSALTVGAVDDQDAIANFSSRGPRAGDEAIKPDITAPGVDIVAAAAANGTLGTPADEGYVTINGTSMAAPHVAGAAAIALQQHPDWSPRLLKGLLMGAARPTEGASVFEQGAGRVDVARLMHQAVSADEGSLSFGLRPWPHDDDAPIARGLTYRNGGTADVTLRLALDADADTFSVSPQTLTVPAGGTARATVTVDTRAAGPYGNVTGRVVATGGDVKVETPIAVNREAENYDVVFRHTGRDGAAAAGYWTTLTSLSTGRTYELFNGDTVTVRLPRGEYGLYSLIYGDTDQSLLIQPRLVVDRATTIDLDARRARPVVVTPPRSDAAQALVAVHGNWIGETVGAGVTVTSAVPGDTYTAQVGDGAELPEFRGLVNSVFAAPDGHGGFTDSPYSYEATYQRLGSFYTGFVKRIRPGSLARVDVRFPREAAGDDVTVVKTNRPHLDTPGSWTESLHSHVPFRRTEWLNTDGPVRWSAEFEQRHQPDPESFPEYLSSSSSPAVRLEAGRAYRQDWNRATFGPSVAGDTDTAVRRDTVIVAGVPLFGEGSGHPGNSDFDHARTALFSGSTLIGEEAAGYAEFEVPGGVAPYRLEMAATRGAPYRLSTSVSGVWTFTSGPGDHRLPLSTVRFSPALDDQNTAPAGAFAVPLTVERPTGSAAAPVRRLTAEVSTDDGHTWRPARVTGTGDHRTVRVTNPADPGAVSLRVHTVDRAGNTATITVVRAYLVR